MRAPLEYGDNFPVPSGLWDPRVPWRFPNGEEPLRRPSLLGHLMPWVMLGLGMTLGVLWMSGSERHPPVSPRDSGELAPPPASEPKQILPRYRPEESQRSLV